MKRTIYFLLISCLLNSFAFIHAVTIRFDFPEYVDKPIMLTFKYGTKDNIVFNGMLDNKGELLLELPKHQADYVGMANLMINNEITTEFIINGENPILKGTENQFNEMDIFFENSLENKNLQKWFAENSIRREKLIFSSQLIRFYKEEDTFFPALKNELETLEKEQIQFDEMLKASDSYVSKFMQLYAFQNNEVQALPYMDSLQLSIVRKYVTEKLDINALYTSGLWFKTLNGLLAMYDTDSPFHTVFIDDMSVLLKQCESDQTYISLAENLFEICEAMDWQQQGEQLVYFILNDGCVTAPEGRLKSLLGAYKLRKGHAAPSLIQGKLSDKKQNVLIFYENGCISCQTELENFTINYPLLEDMNVEVITISADVDKEMYHKLVDDFPWPQKYCDYKGLSGEDCVNYGIIATPTIFLIDKSGMILGRYARFQDIEWSGSDQE